MMKSKIIYLHDLGDDELSNHELRVIARAINALGAEGPVANSIHTTKYFSVSHALKSLIKQIERTQNQ